MHVPAPIVAVPWQGETEPCGEGQRDAAWRPRPAHWNEVLEVFKEVAVHATTSADLNEILTVIGSRLCHLLGVKRCSVYLRRDDGKFQGAAGWSATEGDIGDKIRILVSGIEGDRFTQDIVESRSAVLVVNAQQDPRTIHKTMVRWRVRDMLGVPLVFAGEVIGIIYVDNEQDPHVYDPVQIEVAELFGSLAALVVQQAVLHNRLRAQAIQLTRQKRTLEHLTNVHEQLVRAVLEGADLNRAVQMLSGLLNRPVVLYNPRFDVMAWAAPPGMAMQSAPVIPERVLKMPSVAAVINELNADRPSAIIPPTLAVGLGSRHLLCVLMTEGRPAGYLGVVEIGRAITDLDTKIAEQGAVVMALQVLSERRQIEAEGQAREDFLSDLLRGTRDEEQLMRRAPQFGIDLRSPYVLVRFCYADGQPATPRTARRAVLARALGRGLGMPEPPVIGVPGSDIALVRLTGGSEPAALRRVRRRLEALLRELSAKFKIEKVLVSSVCRRVGDFPLAHREIRELEELTTAFNWSRGLLFADDLGLFRLIVNSNRLKEAVRFATDFVRPLARYDESTGGQLVETLRAYVQAEGQVRGAAELLGVHENTIRYRLAKMREVGSLDPHRMDMLLTARLAFQILDFASGGPLGQASGPAVPAAGSQVV